MEQTLGLQINAKSRIPKYQQIVNSIVHNIEKGRLDMGQKIPSINEVSEEYYLSRDTVEKAYSALKQKRIIVSVKGKGYYIAKTNLVSKFHVLILMNKLSSYKMRIYNSFVKSLEAKAHVDLQIYHCDPKIFLDILKEKMGGYDYYIVMPHFKDENQRHINISSDILDALKKIPSDKLLLLDNDIPELGGAYGSVYQDFKTDIYKALAEAVSLLIKYEKLILVYPSNIMYPYPKEITTGFRKFCVEHQFDFEILDEIYDDMEMVHKDAYILVEETDLVNLIKEARDKEFQLGKDIGIISYNETPLKELLGITVITTDFKAMGETAAYMMLNRKNEKVKNAFRFINRNSV
ncbi:GntR family transcriptional regulator [Fulvivirgaceae bacterium BMA12]|uniref:GntR family transcriptional regulator n=1 Tax=Agaribacillus aureus TaxID=3051825 RepID=A0ABT8L216_9BACT|nr:GntR family transcriptional regulator [Fulvivirgaceae bacterium BMA12]